jgi:predicted dehydrogenase
MGTGWVATARHIPAFKRDRRARIVAVFDRDDAKAKNVARQFKAPQHSNNLDDFLRTPIAAVAICTPPMTHAEAIEAALQAGKHVLVEKPMTLTANEGRALEALANEKGLLLCPSHNFLFSHSVRKVEALLRNGEAGTVQWAMGIQLSSWRRRLPTWYGTLPGGLFFDEAPHLLYLMQRFLGHLEVEHAWQTTPKDQSQSLSERVEARLAGAYGAGYLTMWSGAPLSEWLFVLCCSRAVLVIDLFRDILVHLPPEKAHNASDVLGVTINGTSQAWRGVWSSGVRLIRRRQFYGHDRLVQAFLDSVVDGTPSPTTAQDGWQVVGIMESILHHASQRE